MAQTIPEFLLIVSGSLQMAKKLPCDIKMAIDVAKTSNVYYKVAMYHII